MNDGGIFMRRKFIVVIAVLVIPLLILLADHFLLHEDLHLSYDYDSSSQWHEIVNHRDQYPQELIDLALRNKETIPFVAQYPTHHQIDTVTNIQNDLKDKKMPLLLQWDQRWGYKMYGDDMMAINGCGPTCLSMVVSYLTQNGRYSPYYMAKYSEQNGYYSDEGTSWQYMIRGAETCGVYAKQLSLDEKLIQQELMQGHPIICSVSKGIFTLSGHFIVLAGCQNNQILVYDPNSRQKSHYYDFDEFSHQIRNLWVYSKNSF